MGKTKLNLSPVKIDENYQISFFLIKERGEERILLMDKPFKLELWDETAQEEIIEARYETIYKEGKKIIGEAVIENDKVGSLVMTDNWYQENEQSWRVDRQVKATKIRKKIGIRQRLDVSTDFVEGTNYTDLRYFAPPALYDRNDLDEDGIPDYLGSQNLVYREDRLNIPQIMAYHPKRKISISLIRADLPKFDSIPERPNKERRFYQKTDFGSLGIWNDTSKYLHQIQFRAYFPFYEGEHSLALLNEERPSWGAFWPMEEGELIEVSYKIMVQQARDFHEALWSVFSQMYRDLNPRPVRLSSNHDSLTEYRLSALDKYYYENEQDEDVPVAGFVMNCHPQDGKQLSNIIQYGFTGQNILNAYNYLRYGYLKNKEDYIQKANKVINFFVEKVHIKEIGMFYNLYNVDKKKMDFWWTGLLLPLAYAKPGQSLDKLMGPIYYHWKEVIDQLQKMKGSYLRCMSEDAYALLLCYELEKVKGINNDKWLATAKRYGDFLVKTQEEDGSWYRAYDLNGLPITEPKIWFGTNMYERKSSSGTPILFLVKLYEITLDKKYLDAAVKAGKFVRENLVDPIKFNGGVHDSMYSKGQLIDNEGILYPMVGLLALYKTVGGEYFLEGLKHAAQLCASWICLWDIALPYNSTLQKYGFRSTGMGACDTCGAGYVHPFQLRIVSELVEIAQIIGDEVMLNIAELIFQGCNQTVATPENDWGYKYYGLQEEGYLVSWLLIDDPIFEGTEFGNRLKGEGNKTCFPWIPAVSVFNYWNMIDKFGTTDFSVIKQKFNV